MVDGPSNFMQQNIYFSYANKYALCRIEGTSEVPEMLVGLLECNNSILRMGGCMKFELDVVALFGEKLHCYCLGGSMQ